MNALDQLLAFVIFITIFVINALASRRRGAPTLRPLAAIAAIPRIVNNSIETSQAIHASSGNAAIGTDSTLLALVGQEFIYYLTREVTLGDVPPIVTVADAATVPLAISTVRRAYFADGYDDRYSASAVRWYPAGQRMLAFAAALMTLNNDDHVSANVLVGRFGAEIGLILDASTRSARPSIAVSDRLDGQAIAYGLATYPLIGEEAFAISAYLSEDPAVVRRVQAMDVTRSVFVAVLLILLVVLPFREPLLAILGIGD